MTVIALRALFKTLASAPLLNSTLPRTSLTARPRFLNVLVNELSKSVAI